MKDAGADEARRRRFAGRRVVSIQKLLTSKTHRNTIARDFFQQFLVLTCSRTCLVRACICLNAVSGLVSDKLHSRILTEN